MKGKYLLRISIVILLCIFSQVQAFVGTILEFQALSPSNGDRYGRAVSIDGDTAVICAASSSSGCSNPGDYLYVYRVNGLDWQYEATLTVPGTETALGVGETDRVCIVGDTIVASSPGYNSCRGGVYVFERNGTQWGDPKILTASDGNNSDQFGWAVAYDGNKIVAGSPFNDDYRGAVYVFSRDGSSWSEDQKLVASDGESRTDRGYPAGSYGDRFGMAVAIDVNTIVVGARWDQCSGPDNMFAGSAYVFGYNGTTWSEQDKLEDPDGNDNDSFGISVSVSGDTVIAGAWKLDPNIPGDTSSVGAVYVYEPNGISWDRTAILKDPCNPDEVAYLGYDLEIDGDKIIAGAYRDTDNGSNSGAALLFERNGDSWSEGERLASDVSTTYEYFGYSVAIDGNNVLVGSPYRFTDDQPGKAYMMKLLEPVINEFRVNSYTSNNQQKPAIAIDAEGNFIVVWTSQYQDGDAYGIYGQRFDLYGRRIGDEFLVNVTTSSYQQDPDVAMNANGDFVVVWESVDGDFENIYARRYAADGQPLSGEFLVNTYTDDRQINPAVVLNDNGTFVVIWESFHGTNDWRVAGRVYNAAGNPLASEFDINQSGSCSGCYVVMDMAGDFVVVWNRFLGGAGNDIRMRQYYSNGTPKSNESALVVNKSSSLHPRIAKNGANNYVLTWHYHPDYQQRDIYAQQYDSNFNPVGGEFMVNTTTAGAQKYPEIAMNNDGAFVIVWYGDTDGSGEGIFAQLYNNNANPVGSEIQLNAYTSSTQNMPVVAMRNSTRFITAWQSNGEDGSGYGVYAAFAPKTFLGDFTADGVINCDDLAVLTSRWLKDEPVLDISPSIVGDNTVNFLDFCIFANNWLVGLE